MNTKHLVCAHFCQMAAAYFVLAAALILTAYAWQADKDVVQAEGRAYFEETVSEIQNSIESRLNAYINALVDIRGLFRASISMERNEFKAYTDSIDLVKRYPGIKDIDFIRRLKLSELE